MSDITSIHAERDPDHVLESAKGVFKEVLVIGYAADDSMDIRLSEGLTNESILFMLELFKHSLLAGFYEDDDNE